ncbi:hypothetical protein HNY73_011513 [Argiope bruennichi]|uniref:Uncharacterized protein n=1 Tax=Argiope bruennichi TaxID=94029 RepID=A0A8T0F4E0_ARGBR|nr:hypothetical protein HNY73_011513 [Argiope bruennichi]
MQDEENAQKFKEHSCDQSPSMGYGRQHPVCRRLWIYNIVVTQSRAVPRHHKFFQKPSRELCLKENLPSQSTTSDLFSTIWLGYTAESPRLLRGSLPIVLYDNALCHVALDLQVLGGVGTPSPDMSPCGCSK